MRLIKRMIMFTALVAAISCNSKTENKIPGKMEWQPMLKYVMDLHKKCTHPPKFPFDREWEEIGTGYHYGPAFGHWDIVHQIFDALEYDTDHAINQLYNDIKNQEPHGMIPGSIWFPGKVKKRTKVHWSKHDEGHPPVWVVAVDEYVTKTGNKKVLPDFFAALVRQITWFENARKADGEGYFYNDIIKRRWESGVDEGVRFDEVNLGKFACVDATSHVYQLYHYASKWADMTGVNSDYYVKRKKTLKDFINNSLYNKELDMYFDIWSVNDSTKQHFVFENFWPMIVGAVSKERAYKLIDKYLINPKHFLAEHPVTTVSMSDPKFENRMWRGPAWNSMTFWAVKGCMRYKRYDAAKLILEKALDSSAKQFRKTGTVWEFYHPNVGEQTSVERKRGTIRNIPCEDYLGHNPLIAMAKMYDEIVKMK